jgi:hypothetical protein
MEMAGNIMKCVPRLNEDDKKAIKYALDYGTWLKSYRDERAFSLLKREHVIAALRKAGTSACLATAEKLACVK